MIWPGRRRTDGSAHSAGVRAWRWRTSDSTSKPCRCTEKDKLPGPDDGRVPVIIDGDRVIHDSSAIADYLDAQYPDRPTLFPGAAARGLTKFVQNWTETVLQNSLVRFVVLDIWKHIRPEDQAYFRSSREARFGTTLEEVAKDRDARLPAFRASLDPLRRTVERQDFVSGGAPAYADYIVFGAFQWARAISDFELLTADDPIHAWRGRMLDLHGGLARQAPAYGG
jgi:glutathione S-transferase